VEGTQDWSELARYQTLISVDKFLTRKMRMKFWIFRISLSDKMRVEIVVWGGSMWSGKKMEGNWWWGPWEI